MGPLSYEIILRIKRISLCLNPANSINCKAFCGYFNPPRL
jgi:hypothetical protein